MTRKEYMRQWRAANRDKMRGYQRKYYAANKDKVQEQHRQYYHANKDRILEQQRQWYVENRDKGLNVARRKRTIGLTLLKLWTRQHGYENLTQSDQAILYFVATQQTLDNFHAKVDKTGECWEWTGARNQTGYGKCMVVFDGYQTTPVQAHRLAYALEHGTIPPSSSKNRPESLTVDHMCNNTLCVRPDHLQIVTHAENTRLRDERAAVSA